MLTVIGHYVISHWGNASQSRKDTRTPSHTLGHTPAPTLTTLTTSAGDDVLKLTLTRRCWEQGVAAVGNGAAAAQKGLDTEFAIHSGGRHPQNGKRGLGRASAPSCFHGSVTTIARGHCTPRVRELAHQERESGHTRGCSVLNGHERSLPRQDHAEEASRTGQFLGQQAAWRIPGPAGAGGRAAASRLQSVCSR